MTDWSQFEIVNEEPDPNLFEVVEGPSTSTQPGFLSSAWEGIKGFPGDVYNLSQSIGRLTGGLVTDPVRTVKGIASQPETYRGIAQIGAAGLGATAGAETGGLLGAFGGPLAPFTVPAGAILGGALGGAGGLLLESKGEQALGLEEKTDPAQDISNLGRNFGSGLAFGATAKAIGKATELSGKGAKKLSDIPKAARERFDEKSLGIRAKDIAPDLTDSKTTFFDEGGLPVSPQEAVKFRSEVQNKLDLLRKTGFKFSNNIEENALGLKRIEADNISRLTEIVDEADDLYKTKYTADPEALKTQFEPDWSKVEQFINKEKLGSATAAKGLQRELNLLKKNWTEGPGGFKGLQDLKDSIRYSTNDQSMAAMKRLLYGTVKRQLENKFDEIAKESVSTLKPGQLKEVNAQIGAARVLNQFTPRGISEQTLTKGLSKAFGPISNPLFWAGGGLGLFSPKVGAGLMALTGGSRLLSEFAPGTLSKGFGTLESGAPLLRGAGRAAESIGQGIRRSAPLIQAVGQVQESPVSNEVKLEPQITDSLSSDFLSEFVQGTTNQRAPSQQSNALINAIIQAESGGDARATSNKGARGLMQLMDPTGKEILGKISPEAEYNPYDPQQNIEVGTEYVKGLLEKYGDLKLALAAYNAGPGAVDRMLAKTGASSFDEIERNLPKETRSYVNKIILSLMG